MSTGKTTTAASDEDEALGVAACSLEAASSAAAAASVLLMALAFTNTISWNGCIPSDCIAAALPKCTHTKSSAATVVRVQE